jgi:RNA polymerase sigma factor (TIGR02999 family)
MDEHQPDVTRLLNQWRAGKGSALNELIPMVQSTLRQMAGRYMRGERGGHTLQPTALVNEAFLRLVGAEVTWQSRAHFIAVAARNMRHILVDYAKARASEKRGGNAMQVTLCDTLIGSEEEPEILDMERAMEKLADVDPRKSQVIEMSFYGGMTYDEIGEVLEISPATVDRELRFAKAWLYRELNT